MPDICLCSSKECPRRKECYRSRAQPHLWQSYSDFYVKGNEGCTRFMKIDKTDKLKKDQELQPPSKDEELCPECKQFDRAMNGGPVSFDVLVICEHKKSNQL